MPTFRFRAVDAAGRRSSGRIEAATLVDVRSQLGRRDLLLLGAREARPDHVRSGGLGSGRRSLPATTRAIAALLGAGMPVTRALATARVVARGRLGAVLDDVRARVERGSSVADALAYHPDWFGPFYVGAVRAGERGSDLTGAFERLADHIERQEAVRQQLLSASIYPAILAAVGGCAVLILMLFVVPRFVDLIVESGSALPRSTAALVALSAALRAHWPFLVLAAICGCACVAIVWRSDGARRRFSAVALRLPLVGGLRREVVAARFARLLGVMLRGGAPLLSALEDVEGSIADASAGRAVASVRERVRAGSSLAAAVAECAVFPELLSSLVAVGEESGRLGDFLHRAALLLEDRAQRALERLVTLVEPALIVAFGAVVGFVALALLQAVYGLDVANL